MPTQIPKVVVDYFSSFTPGFRLVDGGQLATMVKLQYSATSGLTALAGGGQPGATLLSAAINEISTVATTGDSVMLPLGLPGMAVIAINDGANTMQVYGQATNPNTGVGDTIAANNSTTQAATTTGVSQASAKVASYLCFAAGKWKQLLSG